MANISIEKKILVPMRDGVHLATDIYRLEVDKTIEARMDIFISQRTKIVAFMEVM